MTADVLTQIEKRKIRRTRKDRFRREILRRLPKGGTCAEVGVWKGQFTREILKNVQPEKLILIDPWQNFSERDDAFDGQTDSTSFEEIYNSVCKNYAPEIRKQQVEIRRMTSADAFAQMKDESLNFVYLDGDHSFDGIKADLDAVFSLVKPGGIIMLDDYHRQGWWGDSVLRAAHEFLGAHPTELRIWAILGAQLAIEKLSPQGAQ